MLYEEVVALIGEVPPGFEPLVYFACIMILLWMLQLSSFSSGGGSNVVASQYVLSLELLDA